MAIADSLIKVLVEHDDMITDFIPETRNTIPDCEGPVTSYGLTGITYDVRLDSKIIIPNFYPQRDLTLDVPHGSKYTLKPGQFILAETVECFNIPREVMGRCLTKSSLARRGVEIITTLLQPTWSGKLVLEIKSIGKDEVELTIGAGIASIEFDKVIGIIDVPYNQQPAARFNDQKGINKFDSTRSAGDPNAE